MILQAQKNMGIIHKNGLSRGAWLPRRVQNHVLREDSGPVSDGDGSLSVSGKMKENETNETLDKGI